jgi:heat shock protein HslJ
METMRRGLVGVALALSLLTACGQATDQPTDQATDQPTDAEEDPGVGTPADGPSPVDLPSGDYLSSDVTGHELVPGTQVSLTWTDGQLRVQAGCNTLFGPASIEDGLLRVADLGTTEMGCSPDLMDQDAWLADFLAGAPEVAGTGGSFTLSGTSTSGTSTQMRFAPVQKAPDLPLEGTTWELESTEEGDVASSGPLGPDTPVTDGGPRRPELRIAQGTLRAFDGCNQLRGPVEVTAGKLRTDELLGTKRACVDPAATRTARLLGELLQESSYAVEGDRLTLRRDDVAMVFRAR